MPTLITRTIAQLLPRTWHGVPVGASRHGDHDGLFQGAPATWDGYEGIIADVQHYGEWVLARSEKQLAEYFHSQPGEKL